MLLKRFIITISCLLGGVRIASALIVYRRCHMPSNAKPFPQFNLTTDKFTTTAIVGVESEPDNLIDQMMVKPCLQIEYKPSSVAHSEHIVIYGTCTLKGMFRFVLKQIHADCWYMQLHVYGMENREMTCKELPLPDSYTGDLSWFRQSQIQLGSNDERLFGNVKRKSAWFWRRGLLDTSEKLPLSLFTEKNVTYLENIACDLCNNYSAEPTELHYDSIFNYFCRPKKQKPKFDGFFLTVCFCMAIMLFVGVLCLVIILFGVYSREINPEVT